MDWITVYLLGIVFIATLVRSTFGFGESLVAVPLLVFFVPTETAVPLAVLISVFIAAVVIVQDRKKVHFKSVKWLVLFAFLGIPIGLYLLVYGNENLVKSVLGFVIVLYSVYSLFSKSNFKLKTDNKLWLFICGFLSGILGGSYGLNGPPIVIYGRLRNWTTKTFRATLQAYFFPVSIIAMVGYWYKGLWTSTVNYYFLISLPAIIPAIFLGRYLNAKLKTETFIKYVYVGLFVIGTLLVAQATFN